MRLVVWLVIAAVVVLWLLHAKKTRLKSDARRRTDTAPGQIESMVRCAHCGVHLPASEALTNPSGAVYCCEEHRLLHRSD